MATIWCFARSYADHAAELGNKVPDEPVVFLKGDHSIRGLEGVAPPFSEVHHEVEWVLRIARDVGVGASAGWEDVDAVALGLDLTHRSRQKALAGSGLPWAAAKSFASATVLGPWLAKSVVPDLDAVAFSLTVDGELRQRGNTRHLVHPVPALLLWLTQWANLVKGDIVFTGTPSGVGPLRPGQRFVMSLDEVGLSWEGQL